MSALSQTYHDCYLVQTTVSQEFLVTVHIYHCAKIVVSAPPGRVLEIEDLVHRIKERMISKHYLGLSKEEKRVVQARIAVLDGGYAVLPDLKELAKFLHELAKSNGYSTQDARSLIQGWLAPLKSHEN